jgi:hypothetical protein
MTFLVIIALIVLIALAIGLRYDRKHRRLDDSASGGVMGRRARNTRLDGKEKTARWMAGS